MYCTFPAVYQGSTSLVDSWQPTPPEETKINGMVFHVSHFKENFSLLPFEEELSGRLGKPPLLTLLPRPLETHDYH